MFASRYQVLTVYVVTVPPAVGGEVSMQLVASEVWPPQTEVAPRSTS